MPVQAPRRLFTVDEFHQMAEAAIFDEDDRVELLAGTIVQITPIGSRHAACVSRLIHVLSRQLGSELLRIQDPVRLDDYSEPQPDVVVVKARADFYRHAHPTAQDVLLLIEVGDTSVESDRSEKVPLYARSGVPEVWVVDLIASRVDVFRVPTGDGYLEHESVASGAVMRPRTLPQLEIPADQIIP